MRTSGARHGWYTLHKMGGGKGGPDATGARAVAFIVGGTICMNVVSAAAVMQNTVGITGIFQTITSASNASNAASSNTLAPAPGG